MPLIDDPANPIPSGAVSGHITTRDNVNLRFARWPAENRPLGTVCILQGRSEFIEKYFETVAELRTRGFAVALFDWRGQGGSDRLLGDPRRGYIDDFSQYGEDLDAFMSQIAMPDCPPPYFGLAHSTGANVILHHALRNRTRFERLVLTAPLIKFARLPVPQAFVRRLAGILTYCGFAQRYIATQGPAPSLSKPFAANALSSDPQRYRRLSQFVKNHPEISIGGSTIGWVYAACRAMQSFEEPDYPKNVGIPTLVVGCGSDKIVSTRAAHDLCGRMRSGGFVLIPGARHEILIESDLYRDQFWAAFDAFIPGSI